MDVETSVEHPYFVVERGWSSYSPNKTLQIYRLSCHQLQVGDVCLTLSPKIQSAIKKQSSNRNENIQQKLNGHHCLSNTIESKLPLKKFDLKISYNDDEEMRNNGSNISNHCVSGNTDNNGNGRNISGNFHMNVINHTEETKKFDKLENDNNNNSNNTNDKYDGLLSKKKRRWSAPDQITEEYHSSPLSPPSSSSTNSTAVSAKNV